MKNLSQGTSLRKLAIPRPTLTLIILGRSVAGTAIEWDTGEKTFTRFISKGNSERELWKNCIGALEKAKFGQKVNFKKSPKKGKNKSKNLNETQL